MKPAPLATEKPAPASTASAPHITDEGSCSYWDYCPNCSQRLQNQGCKYRCPRCHYFMSCSDFD